MMSRRSARAVRVKNQCGFSVVPIRGRGGKPKKECTVWPPMFMAARPVGASNGLRIAGIGFDQRANEMAFAGAGPSGDEHDRSAVRKRGVRLGDRGIGRACKVGNRHGSLY